MKGDSGVKGEKVSHPRKTYQSYQSLAITIREVSQRKDTDYVCDHLCDVVSWTVLFSILRAIRVSLVSSGLPVNREKRVTEVFLVRRDHTVPKETM